MVIVKSVIFFGKSVKNIWNLDFFKYNHKYGTVSQSNSRAVSQPKHGTAEQLLQHGTAEQLLQHGTAEQIQQLSQQNSKSPGTVSQSSSRNRLNRLNRLNRATAQNYFCGME